MYSLMFLLLNILIKFSSTESWEEQFYLLKHFIYGGMYMTEVRTCCFRYFRSVDVTIMLQLGWRMNPLCIFALLAQCSLREINNSVCLTNKRLPLQILLWFRFKVQSRVLIFHVKSGTIGLLATLRSDSGLIFLLGLADGYRQWNK